MAGLSARVASAGGDAGRFLRGGGRGAMKLVMSFWALLRVGGALAGAGRGAMSSSVGGGDESADESLSVMVAVSGAATAVVVWASSRAGVAAE